ncbi:hypothetical protein ACVJBD_006651 [Rhizobium mongolense]
MTVPTCIANRSLRSPNTAVVLTSSLVHGSFSTGGNVEGNVYDRCAPLMRFLRRYWRTFPRTRPPNNSPLSAKCSWGVVTDARSTGELPKRVYDRPVQITVVVAALPGSVIRVGHSCQPTLESCLASTFGAAWQSMLTTPTFCHYLTVKWALSTFARPLAQIRLEISNEP